MNRVEELIEELHLTKDVSVLAELNRMGVTVAFMLDGIRWSFSKRDS